MSRPRFIPGSTVSFKVRNRSGKKDLAAYLGSRLGVVDAWALELLADGLVRLDGIVALPGDRINLSAGPHALEVRFPQVWPRHMAATEMPLSILHEDNDILILDKPSGVVVHPARGHLDNQTLQNGVRHRYRHRLGLAETTIGPPHRLDKDTSGVLVFALTRIAYAGMVDQFAHSRPRKEYLAILDGNPPFTSHACPLPIGGCPVNKGKNIVLPIESGGKAAHTDFIILEKGDGWALALAKPRTGRPHQIRVHAASLGLPLAGDPEYNPAPRRLGMARCALHASALSFTHPVTGCPVIATAPLPSDMEEGLGRLRRRGAPA